MTTLPPRIAQSAWTKLNAYAALVVREYGPPHATPRSVDPDVALATAWRVSTERGFFVQAKGDQLFVELLKRLGIGTQQVQQIREVAAVLVDSPRYTSGCNPSLALRLAL